MNMTKIDEIKNLLDTMGSATIVNRTKVADYIIKNDELLPSLINVLFETDYKLHHKAGWILEFILEDSLEWLIPYLDFFTNNLSTLKNQSAIRPASKICKYISIAYNKDKPIVKANLTKTHIENMIEAGFDWLIEDNKIAPQVYSMTFLYLFGKQNISNLDWVHEELKKILIQDIPNGSSGYKAQGKHILNLIS